MDRRLAWLVVGFGALLLAWAGIQAARGATGLAADVTVGAGLVAAGVLAALGRRAGPPAAWALCGLAAAVQAIHAHGTGRAIPSVPFGVLAIALILAIGADRRARRKRRG